MDTVASELISHLVATEAQYTSVQDTATAEAKLNSTKNGMFSARNNNEDKDLKQRLQSVSKAIKERYTDI